MNDSPTNPHAKSNVEAIEQNTDYYDYLLLNQMLSNSITQLGSKDIVIPTDGTHVKFIGNYLLGGIIGRGIIIYFMIR